MLRALLMLSIVLALVGFSADFGGNPVQAAPDQAGPNQKQADKPANGGEEEPASTEKPAEKGDAKPDKAQPTAEEVLARMRREKPTNEALPPLSKQEEVDSVRSVAARQDLLPEGSPLSNRPGRLIKPDDCWWTFVLESDHKDRPEPRLRLLPCSRLEQMVRAVENASTDIVFVVTGEVTVFDGENYLLVRVARRRTDTGNLKK